MENVFITYENALACLDENIQTFNEIYLPIDQCTGQFLAEDLIADRNFPPYNRVTMDGISIAHDEFLKGRREFMIESTSPAGSPEATLNNVENCVEVMTGTMLPKNTDTVIRYEDVTITNGTARLLEGLQIKKQQNVHFKGMDIAKGSVIVQKGRQISSAEINIAAAVGKAELKVKRLPKVVIISTGDELVDVHESPLPHQIRRSNVYGIRNTLREWGIKADLNHLPDEKLKMTEIIADLLKNYDVLIFTGGVSKGKFDHLPDVLNALKVKRHFHKIQQRPGKPFWFGTSENDKRVFALPGNPVSSFVCLYAYVRHWLLKSLGLLPAQMHVRLLNDVEFKPDLVYFPEAALSNLSTGTLGATAILGNGSGDFANLVKTDGFLILPQEKSIFNKGEVYPFIPYRKNI